MTDDDTTNITLVVTRGGKTYKSMTFKITEANFTGRPSYSGLESEMLYHVAWHVKDAVRCIEYDETGVDPQVAKNAKAREPA
jgi:hypothetical protein